jgi:hypothetical protein
MDPVRKLAASHGHPERKRRTSPNLRSYTRQHWQVLDIMSGPNRLRGRDDERLRTGPLFRESSFV